jgi:tetratricopeptide (TPR) repeat protein
VCGQQLGWPASIQGAAEASVPSPVTTSVPIPAMPVSPRVYQEPRQEPGIPSPPPPEASPPALPPYEALVQPEEHSDERKIAAPRGGRAAFWLGLGVIGAVVLAMCAFLGYKFLTGHSFSKRIDAALAQGHIFSPPGECVADVVAAERAKNPESPKLAEAATKIKAKVWPIVGEAFQRWYKDSDTTVNWDDLEKYCALLEGLCPEDNEIAAFHAYAQAQKAVVLQSYGQAKSFYEEALRKKPNWVLALNGLGKVHARDDSPFKNETIAVGYYQKAIQADPNFTWAYVNLSFYYRGKHDLPTARDYMARALATYPTSSSVLRRMGDICFEMNDRQQALDYYQKALANETDASVQENLRKAIARLETSRSFATFTTDQQRQRAALAEVRLIARGCQDYATDYGGYPNVGLEQHGNLLWAEASRLSPIMAPDYIEQIPAAGRNSALLFTIAIVCG